MILTPRLALCADLCTGSHRTADIGCDHAYLTIALARSGVFVYASDLRPGPLETAKHNIASYGLDERVSLSLSDGLSGIGPGDCDTVAICGMGGETIAAILKAAPWTADGVHALVLQPQTRAEELRRFLAEQGYTVERECLAKEGKRLYVALRARGGFPPCGQENYYLCTDKMYGDPLFCDYLARQSAREKRAMLGKQRAGENTVREERILKRLEELEHGA